MTQKLNTLAVLLLTAGLASACGGGSSKPAASSATSAGSPTSAAAAASTSAAAPPTSAAAAASTSAAAPPTSAAASAAPTSAAPTSAAPASVASASGSGSTTGCSNAAVAVNKATNASTQSELVFSIDLAGGCSTVVITSGIAKGDAAAVTLCNTVAPVAYANGVGAVKILAVDGTSAAATGKKGSPCVSG